MEKPVPHISQSDIPLEALLDDAAKNWLAHDGLWFQAVERAFGLETAIRLDTEAWAAFTVLEARRIMKRLGLTPRGGIPALVRALRYRLYARLNEQEVLEETPARCVFRMKNCRVQEARRRKGLPAFPCRSVGIVEYSGFARTIDDRIHARCLGCPPEPPQDGSACVWEFTLESGQDHG